MQEAAYKGEPIKRTLLTVGEEICAELEQSGGDNCRLSSYSLLEAGYRDAHG